MYATRETWENLYRTYDKLENGPVFPGTTECTISRKALVEEIRRLITPAEGSRLYHFIIGGKGTGKTNLIKLAVDGMDKPKGVVYINIPIGQNLEIGVAKEMQNALGWSPDRPIDSSERNYNSSFQ